MTGSFRTGRVAARLALAGTLLVAGLVGVSGSSVTASSTVAVILHSDVGSYPVTTIVDNGGVVHWINADLKVHQPYKSGCFSGPALKSGEEWSMVVAYDTSKKVLLVNNQVCLNHVSAPSPLGGPNPDVLFTYTSKGYEAIWGQIIVDGDGVSVPLQPGSVPGGGSAGPFHVHISNGG